MRLKTALICLALSGVTLVSHAVNIGRARGAAWIGQPLNMAISVQLDPGQNADALCPEADVFYAETKVETNRVQVSIEANAQGDSATLRVQSSTPVDEPVVTLYVRTGCNQKSTRRYVLFADYASDVVSGVTPGGLQARAPAATLSPVAADTDGPRPTQSVVDSSTASPVTLNQPGSAAPRARPQRKPPPTSDATGAPKALPTPRSARLQLDPLENLEERIKTLEATTTSTPVKSIDQDSQRIQQLQGDIKALLDQAAKNEANLLALRQRLDRAESERIPNTWVATLLLLVAGATAAVFWAWNRRAPSGWQSEPKPSAPLRSAVPLPAERAQMEPADQWPPAPHNTQPARVVEPDPKDKPATPDDLDLGQDDFRNSVFVSTAADVSNSDMMRFGEPRLLHTDLNSPALLDIQQQAELFATLGKANAAIELLEKRIRQNPQDCPLVYLQLLHIANQHNLKTDFRQFREECMQWFNVDIPVFALFRHEGRSLEDYPELLIHLTGLWPGTQVMDAIEICALRDPQAQVADRFDIAAFRDLLLLHAVARYQAYHGTKKKGSDTLATDHIPLDL